MTGIVYMMIGIGLLSIMDALAKWLAMADVAVIQILAIRSAIILPLMLAIMSWRNQLGELKPTRYRWHAARGVIGFVSPLAFFLGLKQIPLTDAVVLFFSSIFIITLMSVIFLKEKVGVHRWASVFAGFLGVLIVANPQGGGELTGYLLVLLGSTTYSLLFISSRYLSSTESVVSLVFSFNLSVGLISALLLPWFWSPMALSDLLLLITLALFALSGHFCLTTAFAKSEASLIAPFEYSAILWAIVFDWIVWQTMPSQTTMGGASIIIASGLYIAHRERSRTGAGHS